MDVQYDCYQLTIRTNKENHFARNASFKNGTAGWSATRHSPRRAQLLNLGQALLQTLKLQTNLRLHGGL